MARKSPRTPRPSPPPKGAPQAAERARLARITAERARARRRRNVVGTAAGVILLVLAGLVFLSRSLSSGGSTAGPTPAPQAVLDALKNVTPERFSAMGRGSVTTLPTPIRASPLKGQSNLPRIVYIGAEYCPYCAVQRWPVIVALSRFGTWGNLQQTTSAAAPEVLPKTSTFSFHGAKYTSDLLSFSGIETETNQVVGNGYAPLDPLPAADNALMRKYDTSGGIPFLDIGGKYAFTGAMYKAELIAGKSHAQIAAALANPDSAIAKGIDGSANVLTSILCAQTGNRPAAVCTSAGVTKASEALRNAG